MTGDAPSAERDVEQESGFDLPIGTYRLGDGTPVARYSHQRFRFTPSGDRDAS
jgi:hypothetical protein